MPALERFTWRRTPNGTTTGGLFPSSSSEQQAFDTAWEEYRRSLSEMKDEYVATAASSLSQLTPLPETAIAALHKVLRIAKDKTVRVAVIRTLGEVGPPAAATAETRASFLRNEDWEIAGAAADTLAAIGPAAAKAVPALKRAFADAAPVDSDVAEDLCGRLAYALARIGTESVPALQELLKTRRPAVAAALAEIGPKAKAAVPSLLDALRLEQEGNVPIARAKPAGWSPLGASKDDTTRLRAETAMALWRIEKHPDAVPALIKCLSDDDWGVYRMPALIRTSLSGDIETRCFPTIATPSNLLTKLAEVGPAAKAATAELRRVLADPKRADRHIEAAWALWKIAHDEEAITILANHVAARKTPVAPLSVDPVSVGYLQQIGPDARTALPGLTSLYREVGGDERHTVLRVIRSIDPKAARELEK
jgi:hypothetical protein